MLGRKVLPQSRVMVYQHRVYLSAACVRRDPAEWASSQPKAKEAWLISSNSIQVSLGRAGATGLGQHPVSLVGAGGLAASRRHLRSEAGLWPMTAYVMLLHNFPDYIQEHRVQPCSQYQHGEVDFHPHCPVKTASYRSAICTRAFRMLLASPAPFVILPGNSRGND